MAESVCAGQAFLDGSLVIFFGYAAGGSWPQRGIRCGLTERLNLSLEEPRPHAVTKAPIGKRHSTLTKHEGPGNAASLVLRDTPKEVPVTERIADAITGVSPNHDADTAPAAPDRTAPAARTAVGGPALEYRPGRWIANWDAENKEQWESLGRGIARRNLNWSIFAEFLGFVVWQLWSIVVVQLPSAGFRFSTNEIFWLISMPSLVGATLRIPYTFMVPRF